VKKGIRRLPPDSQRIIKEDIYDSLSSKCIEVLKVSSPVMFNPAKLGNEEEKERSKPGAPSGVPPTSIQKSKAATITMSEPEPSPSPRTGFESSIPKRGEIVNTVT